MYGTFVYLLGYISNSAAFKRRDKTLSRHSKCCNGAPGGTFFASNVSAEGKLSGSMKPITETFLPGRNAK